MKFKTVCSVFVSLTATWLAVDAQASCLTQAEAQTAITKKHSQNLALLGATFGNLLVMGNVEGDSSQGGWRQRYQLANHASILISECDNTGAHIVQGFIGLQYDLVGDQTLLGFPISDEEKFSSQYIQGRQSKFQNGTIVYKEGGDWKHGTFPILSRSVSGSNLAAVATSTDQLGGTVVTTAFNMAPNSEVQLWINTWAGAMKLDTRKADAHGHVQFPARYISNNDTGGGDAYGYIATLEVDDGQGHFAVVGVTL